MTGDVIGSVALGGGVNATGYLFGERGAMLSGRAYVNANSGAQGVGGVLVTLQDASGEVVATAVTDADGTYSFPNLPAGHYTVTAALPYGYGSTAPTTLSADLTTAGLSAVDFAKTTGTLSGFVYSDANNDGVMEPAEASIGGVLLTLTGTDVTGRAIVLTTVTAADGSYRFTGLLAGTYAVTEAQPSAYLNGKVAAGNLGGLAATNRVDSVTLGAGKDGAGYDFGELAPAALLGTVYYDYDRNGVLDAYDFGIAHVPVTLTGRNDLGQPVILTTVTDANGAYAFNGLRPGTYALKETAPNLLLPGLTTPGTADGTAGVRELQGVTLSAGVSAAGNNFGELQRPGCNLADLAFHIGRSFARDTQLRDSNAALFDARSPRLATFLAAGEVPKGVGTYPNTPVSYYWVPTLGTKVVPMEPWVGAVKVRNGHLSAASVAQVKASKFSGQNHPRPTVQPHAQRPAHKPGR